MSLKETHPEATEIRLLKSGVGWPMKLARQLSQLIEVVE